MKPRFPPYVRFVLGEQMQLCCQEGTIVEMLTPIQPVFLAQQLLHASIIIRKGEQCPSFDLPSSHPS